MSLYYMGQEVKVLYALGTIYHLRLEYPSQIRGC
jgi:hypothetical protein